MGTCENQDARAAISEPRDGLAGDERAGVGDSVFDVRILEELAEMLDDAELDSYLALLESTVRPRVQSLVTQLAAGDAGGLQLTAHALAGGAACYGLTALSAAARQIETEARGAHLDTAQRAVARAVGLVEMSLAAVWSWRHHLRPADAAVPFSGAVATF